MAGPAPDEEARSGPGEPGLRGSARAPGGARGVRTFAKAALLTLALLILLPLAVLHAGFAASLPKLDGTLTAAGLAAPVTITRDAIGYPTIQAGNRADLAYGTGFVHAQDRFFQMDLSRRLAAGELSELFGALALEQDRKARLFRFRALAQQVVADATPEQRAVIEAYARGVNAGLASLRSRPFEYWVLQAKPAPWRAEDVALVSYAMWWDLQSDGIRREMARRAINARLGGAECEDGWKCALAFFYPRGTTWDSPNSAGDATPAAAVRVPTPEELNLRRSRGPSSSSPSGQVRAARMQQTGVSSSPAQSDFEAFPGGRPPSPGERIPAVGSNAWALAGRLSSSGSALVANDMHLRLRVPAIWYRARLRVGQGAGALDASGLTLPGAPVLVAGSNGHVAWGYTNSYGDWIDVAFRPCTAVDGASMRMPDGTTTELAVVRETLRVKGAAPVSFDVKSGPDGLLYDMLPEQGRCVFVRWLASVPGATNFNIMSLERAASVEQALALAPSIGIPHQNLNVGDRAGHIAWSILGRIPEAAGEERLGGSVPWTTAQTHPQLLDPSSGREWTANARPIEDARAEALIGGDEASLGADYDLGARARQIQEGLLALQAPATPADMLRIQLDDRAVFLARWRDLLLTLLDDAALQGFPQRRELKRIASDWRARASTDSVGYRLVRAWHGQTEHAVWQMLLRGLDLDAMRAPPPAQFEGALWELVTSQPTHLLAPEYASWRDFLLAQVDAALKDISGQCPALARCTWGQRMPVAIRHPLSGALPFAARLLDMPSIELAGDHNMPRVQDGAFGASERFAVSPGHETEGYLQIAGGQSGHPLSPYYRAGFMAWAEGRPVPFLPGRAEHELTLRPAN